VSNVLSEEKQKQVVALGRLGWSLRRIEKETGIRRETAASYLRTAGVAVRPPRQWGKESAKPANGVTTGPDEQPSAKPANEVTTGSAAGSASLAAPYREVIELGLSRGRNAMGIYQDLVDKHGFAASYESVKRFVQKLRGTRSPEARAVIVTAPGEEAQVDYGSGPMVLDASSGRYRRTRLFVLTLGYSRKCVRLLTFKSSTRTWCELHETAWRRFGGVVRVVVLDNLREGVLKPDIWDPDINPLYRDLLTHYGTVALPCRVRDPDRKGKVEASVGHAKKTPLRGQRFESLAEAQQYLDHWEERWADKRIHGTTKRQVATMFAEEKPALQPLPIEPFRYYQHGERTVHLDGCVEVEAAYYSAPPGWIGKQLRVQWDGRQVRLLDPATGQLLREHLRQERGRHRIRDEDRPTRTPLPTVQLLARTAKADSRIGAYCEELYARQGAEAVRRIMGILAQIRKYGVGRVSQACAMAAELEIYNARFVRRYLEHQMHPPISLRQIDPLIRQLHLYRDLIEERTQEPNL
jgi:transposase